MRSISTQTSNLPNETLDENEKETENLPKKYVKPKNFICMFCSSSFPCDRDLELHKKSKHEKVKDLRCNQCDYTTTYPNLLKRHEQIKHGDAEFFCTECDKSFPRRDRLNSHFKSAHGEKPRFQ